MPLNEVIQNLISPFSVASRIAGFILLLAIAFILNHQNTKYIFIPERSYMPAIIYLVIVCGLVSYRGYHPALPATIFLLLAFERMLDSYKNENLSYNPFDAGFLLGLGSLFYFNIIFFIVFLWAALAILRPFYWREWLYTLLGAAIPYFVLFSIYYLANLKTETIIIAIKSNFNFHATLDLNKSQLVFMGFLAILILLASQYILKIMPNKKILPRKSYNLFLIEFFIIILIFFCIPSATSELVYIIAVPVSMLISHFFVTARKTRLLEIVFDLLVVFLLVLQLFRF
jgi:hypothetical protein